MSPGPTRGVGAGSKPQQQQQQQQPQQQQPPALYTAPSRDAAKVALAERTVQSCRRVYLHPLRSASDHSDTVLDVFLPLYCVRVCNGGGK